MPFSADDHLWMAHAHRLAARGLYTTHPNPRVGCVLVKDGKLIGEGYHVEAGGWHAEIHALHEAGEQATGATAYVTLEPCSHQGRTPPCSDALIAAGIERVVIALEDPNPAVAGRGIQRLQDAGIVVQSGLQADGCEQLNPGFLKRMRHGRPYVRVKMAQSLDGRTAMASGESQWITGPEARYDVQRLRAQSAAIMTGVGTVLTDNPSLNVRELNARFKQPLRVILDPQATTPPHAILFSIPSPILIAVAEDAQIPEAWLHNEQISLLPLSASGDRLDLSRLMEVLADMEINEVHVEAGATLSGALIEQQLVDELVIYTAPLLLGSDARPLFHLPLASMSEKIRLKRVDQRMVGNDQRVVLKLDY